MRFRISAAHFDRLARISSLPIELVLLSLFWRRFFVVPVSLLILLKPYSLVLLQFLSVFFPPFFISRVPTRRVSRVFCTLCGVAFLTPFQIVFSALALRAGLPFVHQGPIFNLPFSHPLAESLFRFRHSRALAATFQARSIYRLPMRRMPLAAWLPGKIPIQSARLGLGSGDDFRHFSACSTASAPHAWRPPAGHACPSFSCVVFRLVSPMLSFSPITPFLPVFQG